MSRIRVLVIDDSAFARKVIREVLAAQPDLEVVDVARDGGDALEKIGALAPDVITLDLMMPVIDGAGVLRALADVARPPRVVVVSSAGAGTERGIEALQLGAIAVVEKPTTLATERMYEMSEALVAAVRMAAGARPRAIGMPPIPIPAPPRPVVAVAAARRTEVLVIGASTGGPPALTRFLHGLPADFPVPIALVLHLPVEYTAAFARRLDGATPFAVHEASDGMPLRAGEVIVARGDLHLALAKRGAEVVARLRREPAASLHRPSVDVLFASAAEVYGAAALGLVLTGMGDDGLVGARAIHAAGGRLITESEASCVVYGMPRVIVDAGLSEASGTIEELPALVVRSL